MVWARFLWISRIFRKKIVFLNLHFELIVSILLYEKSAYKRFEADWRMRPEIRVILLFWTSRCSKFFRSLVNFFFIALIILLFNLSVLIFPFRLKIPTSLNALIWLKERSTYSSFPEALKTPKIFLKILKLFFNNCFS